MKKHTLEMNHGVVRVKNHIRIPKKLDIKEESPAEKIEEPVIDAVKFAEMIAPVTVEEIHALAKEPAQDFSEKIEEQEKSAADIPTPPVRKKKSKST
jgi:hypothetical protein